ncbi:MAG: hypothetical protein A2698_00680 [Candidatus Levybacteria bacterium RIFCSPHIGHO2_01_FULL_42_15]|nr:MAG: hypothetical protein A2698_00680 [Candidatus Levybacteria bacterium RIFCSPHIGHO2_01_FULL_42_15]OGH42766.1 MAG: hypothetical protein A3B53_01475 [Candidatus Levybacteria bacterium RIFCSPLOWO2_01_FULL_42_15]
MEGDIKMQEGKKTVAVLYIEPTQAYLYGSNITNYLLLKFPPDVVSDQEIVDLENFSKLFWEFFQQHQVTPSHILILLSTGLTFEKEFPDTLSSIDVDKDIKEFIDTVPFDEIVSNIYKLNKKEKVVAINKKLCDEILSILGKLQFQVIAFVPESIAHEVVSELANNLDLSVLLSNADYLKQYSLLKTENTEMYKTTGKKKTEKKRLIFLGGVFFILLAILMVLLIGNVPSNLRQ